MHAKLTGGLAAFLTLALTVHALSPDEPAPQNPVQSAVALGANAFAFDLYGELTGGDQGNLVYSPYSLSTALAMCKAGARGETAKQMEKVLHLPAEDAKMALEYADLILALKCQGQPREFEIMTTNALWPQKGFPFQPEYVKLLQSHFAASAEELDFRGNLEGARQRINQFVAAQTKNKIQELFAPGALTPLSRLVLTNTIYFKADWLSPFEKDSTHPRDFHTGMGPAAKVPTMHRTGHYQYLETDAFQVLEMPYKDRDISMLIVLPKEKNGLAAVEKSLPTAMLSKGLSGGKLTRVAVALPKFKYASSFTLNKVLAGMGMPLAFDPERADFTGMCEQTALCIGVVVHKAVIEVDEKGTEAAAATGIAMRLAGAPIEDKPVSFTADHPFLYVIRDHRTGCILFMGRVTNPAKG